MDDATQQFLTHQYGWTTLKNVQTVHQGENDTFLVLTLGRSFIVRRYRPRHRSADEIAAELAWLELLRGRLNVPETVPTLNGKLFCTDGGALPEEHVLLGSALRAFFSAGKIPERLDIADLAGNPAGVIRRYLEFVAAELEPVR